MEVVNEVVVRVDPRVHLPVYKHLLTSTANINFLWGGRDSGKSHFIAQKMILDCLTSKYFRCVLVRKTLKSIRNSQYQTILEIIKDWGFDHLFTHNTTMMSITCINGNGFLSAGCDDPDNVKSISNPSHAWYEEANQLTETDFITVSTTLRSNRAKVQEWVSFNPECDGDYKQFWLFKNYFAGHKNLFCSFTGVKEIKIPATAFKKEKVVRITYTSTHTTYVDNIHCTPERQAKLEDLRTTNPYYYKVYCLGQWGIRQVDHPFLFAFNHTKHVGHTEYNINEYLYLSFDFNRNPICCTAFQWYDDTVFGLETIKLARSDIYQLCETIAAKYDQAIYIVTGDSTGFNSNALVRDDLNYYKVIQERLELSDGQIQVVRNPIVEENQVICNKAFVKYNIILDEDGCQALIFDCMFAEMLPTGKLKKGDREDVTQQLDALDTMRYFINKFIAPVLPD